MDHNFFDIDRNGNYYFLDQSKHCVFKFSPKGQLIRQIGSKGKRDPELYYPVSILVDKDSLLIGDFEGGKIKRFSLDGEFISVFEIENGIHLNTIRVRNGLIYTDVRYKVDGFAQKKLITVFNEKGEKNKEFGKIVGKTNWVSYRVFNSSIFEIGGDGIYGSFMFHPVIFKYDTDGEMIFFKNLSEYIIPEIDVLSETEKERGLDTPGEKKSAPSNQLRFIRYCGGFSIGENDHLYYALSGFADIPYILHFDSKGKFLRKIFLTYNDEIIKIQGLFIRKQSNYVVGYTDSPKHPILFQFDL